jgi:hypothetical protein
MSPAASSSSGLALGTVVADAKRPPTLPDARLRVRLPIRAPAVPAAARRPPAALRGYFHRDADGYAIAMSVDDHDEEAVDRVSRIRAPAAATRTHAADLAERGLGRVLQHVRAHLARPDG